MIQEAKGREIKSGRVQNEENQFMLHSRIIINLQKVSGEISWGFENVFWAASKE
jgi:hypothetical protein